MTSISEDHDPFNEVKQRSKPSQKLMKEEFFWDCVDEECPFGSDEGWEAYYSFRDWRAKNRERPVIEYVDEIMSGRADEYNEDLLLDEDIVQSIKKPKKAFLGNDFSPGVLDITIIGIGLGQLIDEGKIDKELKRLMKIAIERQKHDAFRPTSRRIAILKACEAVVRNAND